MVHDFETCKGCDEPTGVPTYRLGHELTVHVCSSCDLHYIDHLDAADAGQSGQGTEVTERDLARVGLGHARPERFDLKVDVLAALAQLEGAECLDIGAGGGMFLRRLKDAGAVTHGVEPSRAGCRFAKERLGVEVEQATFETSDWTGREGSLDVVTLWDVIEHVNFPTQTLQSAISLLKPGGLLALDTPDRAGVLYGVSERIYKLTGGRFTGMLSSMYSAAPFSHKHFYRGGDLEALLSRLGCETEVARAFLDYTYPWSWYLKRWMPEPLARLLAPLVGGFIQLVGVENKLLVVARKRA